MSTFSSIRQGIVVMSWIINKWINLRITQQLSFLHWSLIHPTTILDNNNNDRINKEKKRKKQRRRRKYLSLFSTWPFQQYQNDRGEKLRYVIDFRGICNPRTLKMKTRRFDSNSVIQEYLLLFFSQNSLEKIE